MNQYIVRESYLKPSKVKGRLPDVIYRYISNTSDIGNHYDITDKRKNAYLFNESELTHAKFIADCWKMEIKKLE